MDEHYSLGRKTTLGLYVISGLYVLPYCILSDNISLYATGAITVFWIATLIVILFASKNIVLYGPLMLVSVAVLSAALCIASGSIFSMMSIFLVQWLGAIFFMESTIIPITAVIQAFTIIIMLFFPFKGLPGSDRMTTAVFSILSVLIASYFCSTLVKLLNGEVEQNRKNAEERSVLLNELNKRYDEAQQALSAKSEFLAAMSHEIRTPINTIIGMDEVAMRECRQDELIEPLNNISLASSNLLSIINDVLDFSKLEAGRMEIVEKPYELKELLNNIIRMHMMNAEDKGLKFNIYVKPDTPAYLAGDENRINQVFSNLISNAIKYTNKGEVSVSVKSEKSGPGSVLLYFSVRDTGIGIREEDMGKLFQTFQRLEMNRNCTVEGTGLGLSLVSKVVNAMHGEVLVDSKYEEGSVFTVCIPQKLMSDEIIGVFSFDDRNRVNKGALYTNMFVAPKAKILLVDDNQMNLSVASSLLKYTKVSVTQCTSGKQCLYETEKSGYDIIFLDHMMPEMDGIETLRELKNDPNSKCRYTPVIALTANAIAGSRERYLEAGFDDYLSKPIMYRELEEMILKYLPASLVTLTNPSPAAEKASDVKAADSAKATAAPQISPLIDTNVGIGYSSGSEELYHQILTIFSSEVKETVEELEKAYLNADWKTYRIKSHSLKSTARTVGAVGLSDVAKEMEALATDSDASGISLRHKDFIAMCKKVGAEVAKMI